MTVRSSTRNRARSLACSLACCVSALAAAGCSSSSSTPPNPAQNDDIDSSAPSDAGSRDDATTENDSGGSGNGDDAPSPQDGGAAETSVTNATSAGDAGAAAFCSAVCAGLLACSAGVDAGPCHCSAGSAALERKDFVDTFTSCVQGAIVADCADAGGAVQDCQVSAAAAIAPTPAAANFCKNLEFTFCADVLPDCLTNAGIYSDSTIATFAKCLPELPDADVDGGCMNFGVCLANASTPL
jgi:hypothetical protein